MSECMNGILNALLLSKFVINSGSSKLHVVLNALFVNYASKQQCGTCIKLACFYKQTRFIMKPIRDAHQSHDFFFTPEYCSSISNYYVVAIFIIIILFIIIIIIIFIIIIINYYYLY